MSKNRENILLKDGISNRENNLNAIKFIASMMVIVSHAYGFATGYIRTDWFNLLTGGKSDLGALAVNIFFFYSGLLISFSLMKNSDLKRYCKRRFVRIYPAFALVTIAITFLAAPFVTNLDMNEYFTNPETYKYLKNLIFLNEHELPGVFVNNVYGNSVNGQIWTIRVEVCCYILCYVFCRIGFMKKTRVGWSVVFYMLLISTLGYASVSGVPGAYALIMPVTMFYMGIVFAVFGENIKLNLRMNIIAVIGFMILNILQQPILAGMLFLPYVLCYMAFAVKKRVKLLNFWGEYSYEIYLWGGFVAQMIVYMYGGFMSEYVNMLITIPVTLILGLVTKKLIDSFDKGSI